jgi:hypothetical protein
LLIASTLGTSMPSAGGVHPIIKIFASLPIRSLDKLTLQQRLEEIGRSRETATAS